MRYCMGENVEETFPSTRIISNDKAAPSHKFFNFIRDTMISVM